MTDLINKLTRIRTSVVTGGGDALYEIGKEIMADAIKRTPYVTGTLQESGKVHPPEYHNDKASVTLSFGGPDSEARKYAIIVHEDLSSKTQHLHGGGPKFLENAVTESAPYVGEKIALHMMQIWWKE